MALHVLCPHCGTRYEVGDEAAGRTGTCPACGTVARIPAVEIPPTGPATAGGPQGAYAPYTSPQFGAEPGSAGRARRREEAAIRFEVHRRVIAILGMILGVLNVLWALLCVFVAVAAASGALPEMADDPDAPTVAVVYVVLGILSIAAGGLQIMAGILLLGSKRGARNLGIASGVISCANLWNCCMYLLYLGFGIYALIILCGRDARDALKG